MNRNLLVVTFGVGLMLAADSSMVGREGSKDLAFARLLLPCAVYGVMAGVAVRGRAWLWGSLGAATYAAAETLGRLLIPGLHVDFTYFLLAPWSGLLAVLGQSAMRRHREARVLREVTERLLSARPDLMGRGVTEQLSTTLTARLDESVLTEGGLLRAVVAEDREASRNVRLLGYVASAALVALYLATDIGIVLSVGVAVFLACLWAFIWATVASAPGAFDSLMTGYFELASVSFASALRGRPRDIKARIGFGVALVHLRQFDKAIEELTLARRLGLHRFSIGVWIGVERLVALAAYQKGDHNRAVRALQNVLAVFPEHAPTLHSIGLCYEQAGRRRAAVRFFERAARLGSAEAAMKLAEQPQTSDEQGIGESAASGQARGEVTFGD